MSVKTSVTKPNRTLGNGTCAASPDRPRQDAAMLAAIGDLTGHIAHDFNNLLTGIIGNIDMAASRLPKNQVTAADIYLEGARSAASRAAGLIQRLLVFSQRQSLSPSPVPIAALLTDAVDLLNGLIGPAITVHSHCDHAVDQAFCDHAQLETALLTLAMNARDAMPDGGTLTIKATTATRPHPIAGATADYIMLTVTDCGIGMNEACLARAFDPFFTTKPPGQALGLGLSMVYGFIKQSGGDIELESRPGAGTIVRLYLPRHSAAG